MLQSTRRTSSTARRSGSLRPGCRGCSAGGLQHRACTSYGSVLGRSSADGFSLVDGLVDEFVGEFGRPLDEARTGSTVVEAGDQFRRYRRATEAVAVRAHVL